MLCGGPRVRGAIDVRITTRDHDEYKMSIVLAVYRLLRPPHPVLGIASYASTSLLRLQELMSVPFPREAAYQNRLQ